MKKVLIVANLAHASPRIPGLAKYLPDFGWKPIIVTGSSPEETVGKEFEFVQTPFPNVLDLWKKRLHLNLNIGFQRQIGIPFAIRKKRGSITTMLVDNVKSIIAYPDEHKGWKPFAIEAANRILESEKIDAIISSSTPWTAAAIANILKKKRGIPWAADLRDLWSQNHNYHYGRLRQHLDKWLELKILRKADALITVSPLWAEQLSKLHGRDLVYSITNGFDPDQMSNGGIEVTPEFTVTYTGCIYEGKQDIGIFFAAVKDLISEGMVKPEDVHIRFYGPPSEIVDREIRRFGLTGLAKQYGSCERQSAFKRQRESQLLLIFYWNDPRIKGWYPLKTFEYLAAQRPILVVGGSGDDVIEQLLDETNAGKYCRTKGDVKEALRNAYLEYGRKGRVSCDGNIEQISKYSYREMAKKFGMVLDMITQKD